MTIISPADEGPGDALPGAAHDLLDDDAWFVHGSGGLQRRIDEGNQLIGHGRSFRLRGIEGMIRETVGRPQIQKFAGALQGQRANKGVCITTSGFSREAHEYAGITPSKITQPLPPLTQSGHPIPRAALRLPPDWPPLSPRKP